MVFAAGRIWAKASPVIVFELIAEYGAGAIDYIMLVGFWALGIILLVFMIHATAWTHRLTMRDSSVFLLILFLICTCCALVYPAYSGLDGIDYVGAMIVDSILHVYLGSLLCSGIYIIVSVVLCVKGFIKRRR